jgi:hypothetical protein
MLKKKSVKKRGSRKSSRKVSNKKVNLSNLNPKQRKRLSDRVNHLNYEEFKHVKIATFGFTLFLLAVWPELREVLMRAHWGWYLGLFIAFSIKPIRSFWFIPRE